MCLDCIVSNEHKGHTIKSAKEALSTYREEFENAIENDVLPTKKLVDQDLEQIDAIKDELESQRRAYEDRIRTSFGLIRSQVDQLQSIALNNLNVKVQAVHVSQSRFEDSLADMNSQIEQILRVDESMQATMNNNSAIQAGMDLLSTVVTRRNMVENLNASLGLFMENGK